MGLCGTVARVAADGVDGNERTFEAPVRAVLEPEAPIVGGKGVCCGCGEVGSAILRLGSAPVVCEHKTGLCRDEIMIETELSRKKRKMTGCRN